MEWRKSDFLSLLGERCLFVTFKSECTRISEDSINIVHDLTWMHEEADTRLLFHAKHASRQNCDSILVVTPDTDIAMLFLAFSRQITSNLYLRTLTGNKVKIWNINDIKRNLTPRLSNNVSSSINDVCDALIGLHAYTGCDSVSAFAGKGKTKAVKLLLNSDDFIMLFKQLGSDWDITDDQRNRLEQFTCELYGEKKNSINEVRYSLYCKKDGIIGSEKLPPCANSLYFHMKRACYQTRLWRLSLDGVYVVPQPYNSYGWELNDNYVLKVVWFDCKVAPDQCMDLLSCSYKKQCVPNSCCCIDNQLLCTDMCKLDCDNKRREVVDDME